MEEFGLFHLLNSLLSSEQKSAPKNQTTPVEEEVAPAHPAEEKTINKEKPNACAAFFEAHDARAHKRR